VRALRAALASWMTRHAAGVARRAPHRAERWLAWAAALAPSYGAAHEGLVAARRARGDRPAALAAASTAVARFPDNPDAWMRLGEAWLFAFRQEEALAAYERAVAIEERGDALHAAGQLYRRAGRFADAAARFARAYAASGTPASLLANAEALWRAGDERAADEALALWATLVPDGLNRLEEERARLRAGRGAA
jgi:tetratricopeptide (TPR) repeat protein